ncbi:uncharacterized protein [Gossypium hirsutum]|uniref:Uncharacterized protein isoform X2 n=1 Tax=Gossypium hirsutum TaxID=3635 RepID=A0ABM3B558_GOSHI|nr:uncharacterized protein LOC107901692 isoform X2 [Gossypium hirsutum]
MGSFRSWVTSIFYIRLLMLSIGSKQEEQTPLVPSENFLTMGAMRLHFETMAFGSTAMCGRDSFWFWLVNPESGHNYRAVKRWTSQRKLGYCLLDCDKIFVPIHKDIHCCLRNTCPILSWIFPCLCRNICPMPYFRLRTAKEILKLKADSSDVYVGFHQLLSKALLGIEMVCKDIASSDLGS